MILPVWTNVFQPPLYRTKWRSVVRVFTPAGFQQCIDVLFNQLFRQHWSEGFPLKRCTQLHNNLCKNIQHQNLMGYIFQLWFRLKYNTGKIAIKFCTSIQCYIISHILSNPQRYLRTWLKPSHFKVITKLGQTDNYSAKRKWKQKCF